MSKSTVQDPLHGVTLKPVGSRLVETYGWEELGCCIKIKCFTSDPIPIHRLNRHRLFVSAKNG